MVESHYAAVRAAARNASASLQFDVPRSVSTHGRAALRGKNMVPVFRARHCRPARELRVESRRRGFVYRRLWSDGINPDVRIASQKERAAAVPCVRNSRYLRRGGHVLHARRSWPRLARRRCARRAYLLDREQQQSITVNLVGEAASPVSVYSLHAERFALRLAWVAFAFGGSGVEKRKTGKGKRLEYGGGLIGTRSCGAYGSGYMQHENP